MKNVNVLTLATLEKTAHLLRPARGSDSTGVESAELQCSSRAACLAASLLHPRVYRYSAFAAVGRATANGADVCDASVVR